MHRTITALLAAGLCVGVVNAEPTKASHTKQDTKAAEPKAKTLAELFPAEPTPELWLGSKAPELKISEWVRGESVSGFEPGHAYVVEFWATWCGPCIAAFPHVAELQKQYAGKATVIGVNIWERESGAERVELVRNFVADHEEMAYTVAIEEGTAMADTWMKPAGRNGIPSAFIVDGHGKIAWMGHPMGMDEPLEQIVAGTYDVEKAKQEMAKEQRTMTAYNGLRQAVGEESWDRAHDIAQALMIESFQDEPRGLNAVAWFLVSAEEAPAKCHKLAYKAAKMASEQTEWKDWMILDTYALAAFRNGQKDEAIKWQTKAIELAPAEAQGDMREQLESFTTEG